MINKTTPRQSILARIAGLAVASLPLQAHAQAQESLLVQEIRCAGNQRTACDFIREHLYLRASEPLDEAEIRNAELRLSALRNFESVKFHLEKGSQRGAVIVVVEVVEANPVSMESTGGMSARMESRRGVIGGRIAHQNLFGQGKFMDLTVVAAVPSRGDAHFESYDARLRYADPQLFDSRRWFGIASAGYHKRDTQDVHGNYSRLDGAQFDLSVGWRFADFSFVTAGVSWRPNLDWEIGRWRSDGSYTVKRPDYEFSTNVAFGWSNEDDLHFPTRGSTFQLGAGGDYGQNSPSQKPHLQLRKTWHWQDAYWTFKVGGDPSPEYRSSLDESQLVALTYSRPFVAGDDVRRARWYLEPGIGGGAGEGYAPGGEQIYEAGLKLGIRADSKVFGVVNLYLIGSVDVNQ